MTLHKAAKEPAQHRGHVRSIQACKRSGMVTRLPSEFKLSIVKATVKESLMCLVHIPVRALAETVAFGFRRRDSGTIIAADAEKASLECSSVFAAAFMRQGESTDPALAFPSGAVFEGEAAGPLKGSCESGKMCRHISVRRKAHNRSVLCGLRSIKSRF